MTEGERKSKCHKGFPASLRPANYSSESNDPRYGRWEERDEVGMEWEAIVQ